MIAMGEDDDDDNGGSRTGDEVDDYGEGAMTTTMATALRATGYDNDDDGDEQRRRGIR